MGKRKTYAEITRQIKPIKSSENNNEQMMNILRNMHHEIAQMKIKLVKINKRIDLLKQDAYY